MRLRVVLALIVVLLAGCSEAAPARSPLCDVVPPETDLSGQAPTSRHIADLEAYVGRIAAADPSLSAQADSTAKALAEVDRLLAAAGGDPLGLGPDGKPAIAEAARQLRALSDTVAKATQDGC